MLLDNVCQRVNVFAIGIKCGDVMVVFAARVLEVFAIFLLNFFQGFKAIGCKTGADNIDVFDAFRWQGL